MKKNSGNDVRRKIIAINAYEIKLMNKIAATSIQLFNLQLSLRSAQTRRDRLVDCIKTKRIYKIINDQ
jgi:hypothetical protein